VIDEVATRLGPGWELLLENFKYVVSRGCVFCLYESPYESVAMWGGYASAGVTIKTTVGGLRKSLRLDSDHLKIARIQYVHHDEHDFNSSGYSASAPLFLKRHGYESEREVRALVVPNDESPSGYKCPVDLSSLIEGIVVSPQYPLWAVPALRDLVAQAGLHVAIEMSALLKKPPV
jgi:hypothetical protein